MITYKNLDEYIIKEGKIIDEQPRYDKVCISCDHKMLEKTKEILLSLGYHNGEEITVVQELDVAEGWCMIYQDFPPSYAIVHLEEYDEIWRNDRCLCQIHFTCKDCPNIVISS